MQKALISVNVGRDLEYKNLVCTISYHTYDPQLDALFAPICVAGSCNTWTNKKQKPVHLRGRPCILFVYLGLR